MMTTHYSVDGIIETFVKEISKPNLEYNLDYKCDALCEYDIILIKLQRATENIIRVCSRMKSIIGWNFNFEKFYNILLEVPRMPLEILWNIHIFQIMPLEIYLWKIKSKQSVSKFSDQFCIFCFQDCSDRWPLLSAQTGLLSSIIDRAFTYPYDNISEMLESKLVSKTVIENLLQYIFALKEGEISCGRLQAFFSLWTCGTMDTDSLRLFSQFALEKFVNMPKATETEALKVQDNWKKGADPFHFVCIIEKLLETLKKDEIGFILRQSLWDGGTNWKNFSVVISALFQSAEEKSLLNAEIIATLLKDGFEQLNPKSLQRALLIGRLMNLMKDAAFGASYGSWFQTNIGSCLQDKNPQAVLLLIQVLSDMLPLEENIECIKAFLERPMNVPPECQVMNLDYILLLKTRVKDLQPHVDTERVVEKVLCTFRETKRIPPYILEASLMNKHHYLNEFLPALLKPRLIPSVADTRENFIDFLYKSGKIPNYIYQKYKISCSEEQPNLLAGINIGNDSFELSEHNDDSQIIN